jgi:hypothetical protein
MLQSDSINIQSRDINLLCDLFLSRIMTSEHIATLHFGGSKEAAKKRIQKLKAAGFISERRRRPFDPAILFLSRKSFIFLRENGTLSEYPPKTLPALLRRSQVSEMTIRHELEVMDVKVAFHKQISGITGFQIKEFSTWPMLNEFKAARQNCGEKEALVKPDGFIQIEKESQESLSVHTFFLEVDRSHESPEILVTRAGSYLDHYRSGDFAVSCGGERSQYKEYPFRVLVILKTAERRNNLAERLLQNSPPIFTLVYLSTFQEVKNDPLGKIWIRPIEYREVTKNTAFDPERRFRSWPYKRQTERDFLVESRIKKFSLFSEDPNPS